MKAIIFVALLLTSSMAIGVADVTADLGYSALDVTACLVRKAAEDVKNDIVDRATAMKEAALAGLHRLGCIFGCRRMRMMRLRRMNIITAGIKKGLIFGCEKVAIVAVEAKVRPVVGDSIWNDHHGQECAQETVNAKCTEKVNSMIVSRGRREAASPDVRGTPWMIITTASGKRTVPPRHHPCKQHLCQRHSRHRPRRQPSTRASACPTP